MPVLRADLAGGQARSLHLLADFLDAEGRQRGAAGN